MIPISYSLKNIASIFYAQWSWNNTDFLPILLKWIGYLSQFHTDFIIEIGVKLRSFELNQLKSDIECKISWKAVLKCLVGVKMIVSVLCLFVDIKQLQNEMYQNSTDLTWNFEKNIYQNWFFYRYTFGIFNFHIESYWFISNWYQIISYHIFGSIFLYRPCLVQTFQKLANLAITIMVYLS